MSDIVLLGKLAVGIACGVLMVVAVSMRKPQELPRKQFDSISWALLFVSRVGLYVTVFFVLGEDAQSDVTAYFRQGMAVLDGQVPYRDFDSSYGPLFAYLAAGVLTICASAKALVATSILIELISLPLWLCVARRWFNERVTRTATLLYVLSPIPLLNVALNGQNQVWVALLLAVALLLLARRDLTSGFIFGFTVAAVKLLGLLFAPVLWLFARDRLVWLIGFALMPVWIYAILIFNGLDVLVPLKVEAHLVTSGNLLYFLSITGLDLDSSAVKLTSTAALLLALMAVFLIAWARGARDQPRNVVFLITLVLLTMMLMSKKAYASYLVLAFFPICLSLAARSPSLPLLLFIALFSTAAVVEPSLWFRWMKLQYLDVLWQADNSEHIVRWKAGLFLACDLVLLIGYVWWYVRTWRLLWSSPEEANTRG